MKGMYYKTIPVISPALLKRGRNELTGAISYDNRPPPQNPDKVMRDVRVALDRLL